MTLIALTMALAVAAPSAAQATPSGFTVVPGVNVSGSLSSVSAVSSSNVWAVGTTGPSSFTNYPLIEHWNGAHWTMVAPPISGHANLLSVDAVSADDVWVVGQRDGATRNHGLVWHYNGSVWTVVAPPAGSFWIGDVSATSPTNVWAQVSVSSGQHLQHWNGTSWSVPSQAAESVLNVDALSPSLVWTSFYSTRHMIGRWNGSGWHYYSSPGGVIESIGDTSSTDVWGVGLYFNPGGGTGQAFAAHWNGSSMSFSYPPEYPDLHRLFAVAPLSSTDVWAVGDRINDADQQRTLIDHWDGTTWSDLGGPNVGTGLNGLNSIARVPGSSTLWAVGVASGNPLILRRS